MASTQQLPDRLSPDSVDTLTELATILARLRPTVQSSASISTPALGLAGLTNLTGTGNTPVAAAGATPAPASGAGTGTTPSQSATPNAGGTANGGGISFKELPAATDNLKHKLQRARVAVRSLPDVSRSIKQQEAEIAELEALRGKQTAQLESSEADRLESWLNPIAMFMLAVIGVATIWFTAPVAQALLSLVLGLQDPTPVVSSGRWSYVRWRKNKQIPLGVFVSILAI